MSTTENRDPTKESRDNPVTLKGEWVQEAAEGCRIGHESGLDGASATPAVGIMAVHRPREVEDVGFERNPEEEDDRKESVEAEEDSDIGTVEEQVEEEQEEEEENVEDQDVVDTHQFPMAGFQFMFLDLIHAILNRVYYNNHTMIRRPCVNQQGETSGPSATAHSSEVQVPLGPIPTTVRAAEYEGRSLGLTRSLPEVISTFPELEEPIDFDEADYYLPQPDLWVREPAVRAAAKELAEQAIEEVAPEATAEDPAKEVIQQIMASEDECHYDIWNEEDNIFEDEEEKGEEKKNQGALEVDPAPAGSSSSKSS